MKYRGTELGLSTNDPVDVYRSADEVMNRASLASLEGKPITDGHPAQFITSENVGWYGKGHAQNVREGPVLGGEQTVVADLVITDSSLIEKIKRGTRDISVGYDTQYTARDDGSFSQENIRANHIAIVATGRAGPDIRILDAAGRLELSFVDATRQYHRRNPVEVAAGLAASALRANDSLIDDWAEAQELNDRTVRESLIAFGVNPPEEMDLPMANEKLNREDSAKLDQILKTVTKLAQASRDDGLIPVNDAAVTDRAKEARDFEFMLRAYRNLSPSEGKRRAEELAASEIQRPLHTADSETDPDRRYEAAIRAARKKMLSQ